MAVSLDDVVRLAEQLDAEQQNLLIYRLRVKQLQERAPRESDQADDPERTHSPTHYAHSPSTGMTAEEFHAQMHAIATEWEQELDEFYDNA